MGFFPTIKKRGFKGGFSEVLYKKRVRDKISVRNEERSK